MSRKFTRYPKLTICGSTNPQFRDSLISQAAFIFESLNQVANAATDKLELAETSDVGAMLDCFQDISDTQISSSISGITFNRSLDLAYGFGEGVCYFWVGFPMRVYHSFKAEYPKYDEGDGVDECILRIGAHATNGTLDVVTPDASMLVDELMYFSSQRTAPLSQQEITIILKEYVQFINDSLTDALSRIL